MRDEFGKIKKGVRVRLKRDAHVMSGWRGTATMIDDGQAIKDGYSDWRGLVDACDWQWSICRDQTPNPEHKEMLEKWDNLNERFA